MENFTVQNYEIPYSTKVALNLVIKNLTSMNAGDFVTEELLLPSTHIINSNAKFIRPLLVLEFARILGYDPNEFVGLAESLELLHTASLVHDDIIDEEEIRRGAETVNKKYGGCTALLAGDALIAKAVSKAAPFGTSVVSAMSDSAMVTCAGEELEYTLYKRGELPDIDTYIKILRMKSGELIGTACSMPAVYKNDKAAANLKEFGINVGVAFQIRDDIIDFLGLDAKNSNEASVNKEKNKMNLLAIMTKKYGRNIEEAKKDARDLNNKFIDLAESLLQEDIISGIRGYIELIRVS
jgi:geranylgeranyl pyrophosphate synthase